MVKNAERKAEKARKRAKKSDIISSRKVSRSSRIRSQVGQRWQPIGTFLAKEYHLPVPDNKVGRLLNKRIRLPKYFRESWKELKKVEWPTRNESIRLTIAVFIFSAFFALITAIADYGFTKGVERIILR